MRMRLAVKEIPERKIYAAGQEARRALLEESDNLTKATVESMLKENAKEFPTRAYVALQLEFLRLLCEGHQEKMQQYLRDQPSTLYDIDIVTEVVKLTLDLAEYLDNDNSSELVACIELLSELVQGERSRQNARLLLDTKVFVVAGRLLMSTPYSETAPLDSGMVALLRHQILVLIHAVAEGGADDVIEQLRNLLVVDGLAEVASGWHAEQAASDSPFRDVEERSLQGQNVMLVYMLIWQLLDFHAGAQGQETMRFLGIKALREQAARVEIVNGDGALERIYFQLPRHCAYLTTQSKQRLLWEVDRNTPGRQIQQFLDAVYGMQLEMQHEQRLSETRLLRWLVQVPALELTTALSVVQNGLLIAEAASKSDRYQRVLNNASTAIGVVQVTVCVTLSLKHFVRHSMLRLMEHSYHGSYSELLHRARHDVIFMIRLLVRSAVILVSDFQFVVHQFALAFAVLGLVVHNVFFSFHLFQVLEQSQTLQQILRSVTTNGFQLLVVCGYTCIIIYVYALWAYYGIDDHGAWKQDTYCQSIIGCFMTITDSMANGDVEISMLPAVPASDGREQWDYLNRWAFQFSFFVIVIVVQLNMIFGIILDTFSELRGIHSAKLTNMQNTCFICGLDRFTFDIKSKRAGRSMVIGNGEQGFERHIHEDHNMWAYVGMMVHVLEKVRALMPH